MTVKRLSSQIPYQDGGNSRAASCVQLDREDTVSFLLSLKIKVKLNG